MNHTPAMTPRLLTEQAAADYLSLPRTAMKQVRAGRTAIAGKVRWDRMALDAWLDEQRGVAAQLPAADDAPEAALDRFLSRRDEDAPRRP
jgi:hypothetical protein